LRYIRLGEHEILRHWYVAVRDHNWDTIPFTLSNVQVNSRADSFDIVFTTSHRQKEIDFAWQGQITGDAQGTIRFVMDGQVNRTFRRNRIGFCVLHPMTCAGLPVEWVKVDGTREQSVFPQTISPHQPFLELRGMKHEVVPGVWAELQFAGETFETEDHRNWTDASIKTYCTPLRLPFPVEVKTGERIVQAVTLLLHGQIPTVSVPAKPLTVSLAEAPLKPLPRLGLGMASHGQSLQPQEITRLKILNPAHLRVDVVLADPHCEHRLWQASREAEALRVPLEVALFLSDAAAEELSRLPEVLTRVKPLVCTWLIFHSKEKTTRGKWVQQALPVLKAYVPAAKLGTGTNMYFTELNRNRPSLEGVEVVSYSINPQVHAFDNTTLVENLEAQRITVESARQFIGDTLLAISPVTLRPRFNPNATGPEPAPAPGELPLPVDVRQMSLFGAGWTMGSLKYLAESGVYSITYYETTGWRGVMETAQGSPLPDTFRSQPGTVFPLYHVFADIAPFAGGVVLPMRSSDPLRVDALGMHKDRQVRVLVANLSPEPQRVTVMGVTSSVRIRPLDEQNVEYAMHAPEEFCQERGKEVETTQGHLELLLPPYALTRIDYQALAGGLWEVPP
jgi:hypothetical protein